MKKHDMNTAAAREAIARKQIGAISNTGYTSVINLEREKRKRKGERGGQRGRESRRQTDRTLLCSR